MRCHIRFQNRPFLFIGNESKTDGSIATVHQYRNGLPSHAHLFADGRIVRYGEIIGSREDIEWGDVASVTPTLDAFASLVIYGTFCKEMDDTRKT